MCGSRAFSAHLLSDTKDERAVLVGRADGIINHPWVGVPVFRASLSWWSKLLALSVSVKGAQRKGDLSALVVSRLLAKGGFA